MIFARAHYQHFTSQRNGHFGRQWAPLLSFTSHRPFWKKKKNLCISFNRGVCPSSTSKWPPLSTCCRLHFFLYFLIDFQWKLFGTELATVCYIDMRFDHIVAPTTSSQVEKSVSTTLSPRNRSTHILYRWCTGNTHRGSRDLFTPAPSFFSSFPFVSCVFHGTLLINLPPWRPLINISIHFLVFRSPKRDPRSRDVLGGYLKSTAVRWTHSCATGLVSLLICTGH